MPSPQRLPRFARDPDAAGQFQFTKRDLDILRHIAEHRFIRSEWIVKLVGGSPQQVLRRLHLLFHHGYLERPRAQLDYFHDGGSKRLVYGLASRGAGRLRRDANMPFDRMDWTTRNKRVGRLFMEHTLMVSDFMAALEFNAKGHGYFKFTSPDEVAQLTGQSDRRDPFRWTVDLPGRKRAVVVPDKVFAVDTPNVSEPGDTRTFYFFEADTGSMPVLRTNLSRSCIERKLKAYEATHASGIARARLKMSRFRVLILCKNKERTENICRAIKSLKCKDKLFLVSYIGASGDLFPWHLFSGSSTCSVD
jgi:hypothetical protein